MVSSIQRLFQKLTELTYFKPHMLFSADLARLGNKENIVPGNFKVECHKTEEKIPKQDRSALFSYVGEKIIRFDMKERFGKGSVLWLVKVDDMLVGYIWTISGITIQPHFFPVTDNDVHFFDNFIFEEFRGRGINPVFVDYVLWKVKKQGLIRAFIDTKTTNTPEIRSLAKTHFKPYGLARKLYICGRDITVWTQRPDLDKYRKASGRM